MDEWCGLLLKNNVRLVLAVRTALFCLFCQDLLLQFGKQIPRRKILVVAAERAVLQNYTSCKIFLCCIINHCRNVITFRYSWSLAASLIALKAVCSLCPSKQVMLLMAHMPLLRWVVLQPPITVACNRLPLRSPALWVYLGYPASPRERVRPDFHSGRLWTTLMSSLLL